MHLEFDLYYVVNLFNPYSLADETNSYGTISARGYDLKFERQAGQINVK